MLPIIAQRKGKCNYVIMSQKSSAATGILKLQNKNKEDNTMSAMNINKNNFHEEVMNSDKPVLVDFWAPWCGPCRMVVPIVEEIAAEHPEYKVVKVNVDEEVELASQFKVYSIPTLVVVKNGQVVSQSVGAKPKNQILAMLG
jgi:thioredoxin 1